MPMIRIVYDTKKTAPLEKEDAMTLSGLFAVSSKLSPVKIPSRLVNRAVPAQNAITEDRTLARNHESRLRILTDIDDDPLPIAAPCCVMKL